MSRALKDAAYAALADLGKALGHAHRLELLDLLAQAPRDVESLARGTERSVASTSQHLQVLARARLVQRERDGVRVIYALAQGSRALLAQLEAVGLARSAELRELRPAWLAEHPSVAVVDAGELADLRAQDRVLLIDVRPSREFAHGHLPGARSIPLDQLAERLDELPRDRELIAVCRGPWCTWADEAVESLVAAGFQARRYEGRRLG